MYSTALQAQTSRFLFFPDVFSLLRQDGLSTPQIIVVDNADGYIDAANTVAVLRRSNVYGDSIILVITQDNDLDAGVAVLKAGASDYLPIARVEQELAVRLDAHWHTRIDLHPHDGVSVNLDEIYPEEDRLLIQRVAQHIDQNMSSVVSVGDLADDMGRSEKDLNTVFTYHLGMTVFAYLRASRMNKAKNLLAHTRMSIAQLALEVGYSNPANFSTAFKRIVGVSPKEYRANTLSGGRKKN